MSGDDFRPVVVGKVQGHLRTWDDSRNGVPGTYVDISLHLDERLVAGLRVLGLFAQQLARELESNVVLGEDPEGGAS